MVSIKKNLKNIKNSIPFSSSVLIYFVILLLMPILNLIIVVKYPSFTVYIIILFLIALLVVLQKIKKDSGAFTSIFIMYMVAISSMTEYASPWTIPLFTAYVAHLADNIHKFNEEKKKKK